MAGTFPTLFAIALGAVIGAWLRWGLGVWLNGMHLALAVGTWTANLLGGFLIGAAFAWFTRHPEIDVLWRLFFITGFLGALTTFSTFSLESLLLIQRGQFGWAMFHSGLHLFGSLGAAAIGHRMLSA